MNTYYHPDGRKEIEAILADGFTDEVLQTKGNCSRGVYIADSPGPLDSKFPDDLLLEIGLPEVIDLSPWQLPESHTEYREWVVPGVILNQHAKLRLVARKEWEQLWVALRSKQTADAVQKLVAQGVLEQAYRDGQAVYRMTPKGRQLGNGK
jgi:hypothetical protein